MATPYWDFCTGGSHFQHLGYRFLKIKVWGESGSDQVTATIYFCILFQVDNDATRVFIPPPDDPSMLCINLIRKNNLSKAFYVYFFPAKPRGRSNAAVLRGPEGVAAHRGPRCRVCSVQNGWECRGIHTVLLRCPQSSRRKGPKTLLVLFLSLSLTLL